MCPPEEISKNIFTLRIHLDETGYKNGPLKVIPGSHKKRFNDKEIQTITENSVPYTCEVSEGGVQLLKPLLLHSSAKSISQKNRRVIHLEFCSTNLPKPSGHTNLPSLTVLIAYQELRFRNTYQL